MRSRTPRARRFQALVAMGCAAILLSALWLVRVVHAHAAESTPTRSAPQTTSSPDAIHLTEAQWASLDIRQVQAMAFRAQAEVDGVIAVDDRLTVPIFSPATGRITAVDVEPGQMVHRGQTLASLAGVETAQAVSDLATASAQARTANRQLTLAREVADRQQGLVAAGGGAAKDWHQAQSDLIAAEGAARIADATLSAARVKLNSVGTDVSTLPSAQAAAHLAAPVDGQIIQRQVAAGQFVSSLAAGGQAPLFTISDLRHVWVIGSVGERDGSTLRVGQAVEVTTLASTGQPLKSIISWVAPVVDPQTRRVQFRAELANPDLTLKPQMTAHVRVLDAHATPTIAIPALAVIRDGDEAHCYVASSMHTLTLRKLKLGRTEAGLTEVLSGLTPGEQVVARGAIFVDTVAEGATS